MKCNSTKIIKLYMVNIILVIFSEAIWRTDLDWMVIHRDRLVVLSFMNPAGNLSTLTGFITPQPFVTAAPEREVKNDFNGVVPTTTGLSHINETIETRTEETSTKFSTINRPVLTNPNVHRIIVNSTTTILSSNNTTTSKTTSGIPETNSSTSSVTTPTTSSTNSATKYPTTLKRPTIRPILKNNNPKNRSKVKNLTRTSTTIRPSKNIQTLSGGNMTAQSMSLLMNSLADLDHPENLNLELQPSKFLKMEWGGGDRPKIFISFYFLLMSEKIKENFLSFSIFLFFLFS